MARVNKRKCKLLRGSLDSFKIDSFSPLNLSLAKFDIRSEVSTVLSVNKVSIYPSIVSCSNWPFSNFRQGNWVGHFSSVILPGRDFGGGPANWIFVHMRWYTNLLGARRRVVQIERKKVEHSFSMFYWTIARPATTMTTGQVCPVRKWREKIAEVKVKHGTFYLFIFPLSLEMSPVPPKKRVNCVSKVIIHPMDN